MHETLMIPREEQRQGVAMELQAALVELLDLGLKGKQAHWNLVGPGFLTIHRMLDELVDEYRDLADTVAERCVTIGVAPDGLASTVAQASRLPEMPRGRIQDRQAVECLISCLAESCKRMRERCGRVGTVDLVTQDTFVRILRKLEKQLWMLESKLA